MGSSPDLAPITKGVVQAWHEVKEMTPGTDEHKEEFGEVAAFQMADCC